MKYLVSVFGTSLTGFQSSIPFTKYNLKPACLGDGSSETTLLRIPHPRCGILGLVPGEMGRRGNFSGSEGRRGGLSETTDKVEVGRRASWKS